jgi:hypothetical protein
MMTDWNIFWDPIRDIHVWVTLPSGKYIPIAVSPSATVKELQEVVIDVVPNFGGKGWELVFEARELKRHQKIRSAKIGNDSVLELVPWGTLARNYPISVVVVTSHERLRYGFDPNETLKQFLRRLNEDDQESKDSEKENAEAGGKQRDVLTGLMFQGKALPAEQPLGECGVTMGSVLTATYQRSTVISIGVYLMTGALPWLEYEDEFCVKKPMKAYVSDIKETIQAWKSIPIADQRLMYAGRELDDSKTLEEEGAEDGWYVHLVRRSQQNQFPKL